MTTNTIVESLKSQIEKFQADTSAKKVGHVIEVFDEMMKTRNTVKGYKITKEAKLLRHFTAHFEKLQ